MDCDKSKVLESRGLGDSVTLQSSSLPSTCAWWPSHVTEGGCFAGRGFCIHDRYVFIVRLRACWDASTLVRKINPDSHVKFHLKYPSYLQFWKSYVFLGHKIERINMREEGKHFPSPRVSAAAVLAASKAVQLCPETPREGTVHSGGHVSSVIISYTCEGGFIQNSTAKKSVLK